VSFIAPSRPDIPAEAPMLKKLIFATVILAVLGLGIWLIRDIDKFLFAYAPWALLEAFILGAAVGLTRSILRRRAALWGAGPERHSVDSFLEHWGTASGIFMLIFSGYWISSGGLFARNLHFLGVVVTLFFGGYFLADFIVSRKYNSLLPEGRDITGGTLGKYFFRGYWIETGKYLSSQKAAFLVFAVIGSELLFTGLIKTLAFFSSVPPDLLKITTSIHDIVGGFFVVMLFVHIALVIAVRAHRPLLGSWLSGEAGEVTRDRA